MAAIRKFLRLPWQDKHLLLAAALWLGLIRLGLVLFPFSTLRVALDMAGRRGTLFRFQSSEDRVAWAVMVASRRLPLGSSCLTRALAARVMLARRALPARIVIGVAKNTQGSLEAHAWLEYGDRVLIGGPDVSRFIPLTNANEEILEAVD